MNARKLDVPKETLTLEELNTNDITKSFIDYISVKDANIPGFEDIFPTHCECGGEFIFSKEYTVIQCVNPRCYIKHGYMLSELFTRFNVKHIGDATCIYLMRNLRKHLSIMSFTSVFSINQEIIRNILTPSQYEHFINGLAIIKSNYITFGDLVANLGLPDLNTKAKNIFTDIASVKEFIEKTNYLDNLKTYLSDYGIYASQVEFSIRNYLYDIALMESILKQKLKRNSKYKIPIVITGNIYPDDNKMTKNEFIQLLNSYTEPYITFELSAAASSVDYIVADFPSGTAKYRKGLERNVLITSTNLLSIAKNFNKSN